MEDKDHAKLNNMVIKTKEEGCGTNDMNCHQMRN
jgi:hypothetical protein